MIFETLLTECTQKGASDIHIKEGEPIMLRIEGILVNSVITTLPDKIIMFDFLYTFLHGKKEKISYFKHNMDIDFGYQAADGSSYRGNAYMHRGKMAIALRRIPEKIRTIVELGLPKSLSKALQAKEGLFIVAGPTGSGKSTALAAMLEAINEFRNEHIITIEDPIEYIFQSKHSIFSQREVGKDTLSFASAIRSAMREDADIILIGEIRDRESMEVALSLAETGHLVFATLHTSGSVQTLSRIIQFFPSELEIQTKNRLADSLIGVLSQRLIPRKDGAGRIGIRELMYVNSGIRNLIVQGDFIQIPNAIEMGQDDGMITMKSYAESLRKQGIIEEKEYRGYI